ncbi:MAG: hypothetical protein ABJH98_03470 [Reichenbachiella sp.]|uniref:hypothetical protein n=1 Tax=Reichenbachiella sp. TaxID=2184521 RepID=UPI003299306F
MKILLIIATFFIPIVSYAQPTTSIAGGFSSTVISVSTDQEFQNPYNMGLGAFLKGGYEQNEWLTYEVLLEYSRIKLRNETQLVDVVGGDLGSLKTINQNFNIQLGALLSKNLNKLSIATGLAIQYAISSKIIYKQKSDDFKTENNSIRPFNIIIPIQLTYPIGSVSLLARYERSILNRLKNTDGNIKEFENDLRIGISYQFK